MVKRLASLVLWLGGWKIEGELPKHRKAVIISVPHTSGWDFVWGELCFLSKGLPIYVLMKKETFFFPLNVLLKNLNVIPVDRGSRHSVLVQNIVSEFNSRDDMYLCLTPEGSRKKVKKWKKGFLVIAQEAQVPIYLGRIDYKNRTCDFGRVFHPSSNIESDLRYIMSTYRDVHPKYPDNFSCGE